MQIEFKPRQLFTSAKGTPIPVDKKYCENSSTIVLPVPCSHKKSVSFHFWKMNLPASCYQKCEMPVHRRVGNTCGKLPETWNNICGTFAEETS